MRVVSTSELAAIAPIERADAFELLPLPDFARFSYAPIYIEPLPEAGTPCNAITAPYTASDDEPAPSLLKLLAGVCGLFGFGFLVFASFLTSI